MVTPASLENSWIRYDAGDVFFGCRFTVASRRSSSALTLREGQEDMLERTADLGALWRCETRLHPCRMPRVGLVREPAAARYPACAGGVGRRGHSARRHRRRSDDRIRLRTRDD